MKKVYKKKVRLSVNNHRCVNWVADTIHYGEMPDDEYIKETRFAEACLMADRGHGVKVEETFLKHEPYFLIDVGLSEYRISQKDFKHLEKFVDYIETPNMSIKELAEELPAGDFVEWLKDNRVDTVIKI